ncbi:NADH-dependent phenylglyoxylate dehydrogenase subunit alpha [Austwickia sp. TVS 96-490-7B]|uniref:3-methyl-2-oxobutanoate dehydrogenase subunit VorB n=1 Tax=Austwickia sp. TVS 96-490-7B TaxID=2830843 RepID=UPI001C57399A|nr:3-methyl-2-oxobutanoate dehydrogenase subunit VorB [Austwickia sp. TVS 96-490-7B]MBW3086944.1 NADH-dependent phenylglyoxylate dehydrogenase subunit alpha [Austwickia sp. TVS 96-490-7B]
MPKTLMKGNEVIGAAAINAGCRFFFGYPITPQTELPEYMAAHLPHIGGTFVQAESEVAAINMVYGAAGSGARCMTSSSSPGIALKQEGISYIAGAELPCVIVNIVRGGPGLGGIQPAQSDYNQATRGGGDGDYKLLVYAPATLQELADLVQIAFDKADYYRNPVMIIGDGMLGQMMEPVELRNDLPKMDLPPKDWATTGTQGVREPNIINSLFLKPEELETHIHHLFDKYDEMRLKEPMAERYRLDGAKIAIVAYGTTSRIVKSAIEILEEDGIRTGLLRPITLFPFPMSEFLELPASVEHLLVVEMSMGQMIDDVRIANEGRLPISFVGRTGGMIPTPRLIADKVKDILEGDLR